MSENRSDMWHVDAEMSLQAILDSPECSLLLRQTLTGTISWQVRNETPVRRPLTSPHVAPRWVAALLALGSTVTVEGNAGPAEMTLKALLQQRKRGKVTALHVPKETAALRWGEAHVARTPADDPIVAAIAVVAMADPSAGLEQRNVVRHAQVALTGVWHTSVQLAEAPARLVGRPLDEAGIRAVAEAVQEEVMPKGDFRGSEEYRRAMAGVLTRRALEECLSQEAEDE
jgi:CO/xanthine dehydrogenase FAD-binding subunit